MRPKGKLFALLAVFTAIGVITASSAFTTVSAERTADVTTAGDAGALLALEPHQNSDNGAGQYAINNSGQLELQLAPGEGATGVNLNAVTEIELVFNVTNQGSQTVNIQIIKEGANANIVDFYSGTAATPFNTQIDNESGNTETLSPGAITQISMKIDTTTAPSFDGDEELLNGITINATAT